MYRVNIRYSKDGKSWNNTSKDVKAESDMAAIAMAQSQFSRYPYVQVTGCKKIR